MHSWCLWRKIGFLSFLASSAFFPLLWVKPSKNRRKRKEPIQKKLFVTFFSFISQKFFTAWSFSPFSVLMFSLFFTAWSFSSSSVLTFSSLFSSSKISPSLLDSSLESLPCHLQPIALKTSVHHHPLHLRISFLDMFTPRDAHCFWQNQISKTRFQKSDFRNQI